MRLISLRLISSRAFALSIRMSFHESVQARFAQALRLGIAHCFRGDGEIRTHDPLLARQVLSQLSYTPINIRQPPALPCRPQHSTIGRLRLNHRVRDV